MTDSNVYQNEADSVCSLFNLLRGDIPSTTFVPFLINPAGTLRARFFYLQGGGLYVRGTATLTNSNIYSNTATNVRCSHLCNVPSPRWNVTRAHGWQAGGGLYITGTATLTNINVYSNQAASVCSPFNLSL